MENPDDITDREEAERKEMMEEVDRQLAGRRRESTEQNRIMRNLTIQSIYSKNSNKPWSTTHESVGDMNVTEIHLDGPPEESEEVQ